MKTVDSRVIVKKKTAQERWAEYFEELLNAEEDRETEILDV